MNENESEPISRQRGRPRNVPVFTQAEIVKAIQDWTRLFGEPPTTADWDVALAHRRGELWRIERRGDRDWPTARMVRGQFGALTIAIRAAGLPAVTPQRPRRSSAQPADVINAIQRWTAMYGEPPAHTDWEPSRAKRNGHLWRVARYYSGDWPSAHAVRTHFGTFGAAVTASGLTPRRQGVRTRVNPSLAVSDKLAMRRVATAEAPCVERQRLAATLGAVMSAERDRDGQRLREGLIDLAVTALRWAEGLHPGLDTELADAA